ncbi:putative RAB-interacting protein [Trypanosoma theileri]|uniref:PRA1 family protein n=1 Tax=Trypanosoma theileri TaxID=67003 RepID=A0A1X0P100_9TRYP|nr:putative RAB-interacting protein [Trypanosoma theileri]ORC90614.1 putative RAB-interacting protein [Trypanosoma theileri]
MSTSSNTYTTSDDPSTDITSTMDRAPGASASSLFSSSLMTDQQGEKIRNLDKKVERNDSGIISSSYDLIEKMMEIRGELRKEQLPWMEDFLDQKQFVLPKSKGEALERLNLNLPYYGANYIVVFYTLTLPFLVVYDPLFFLLVFLSAILLHTIHLREKKRSRFAAHISISGICVSYKRIVDLYIIILLGLFLFWDGLRTVGIVLLINGLVILPHAVWRRPTYFDDEELEKLRPKMVQYIISLILLILVYLECKGAPMGMDKKYRQK